LIGAVRLKALFGRFTRTRRRSAPRIGLIVDPAFWIHHGHVPVLLKIMEGTLGRVDRNVREVGTAETFELGIEVGEVTSLKQRIVGKIDAGHNVLRAERDLFGLAKEIVHTAIEDEPADATDGDILFRDDLS